MKIIDTHMHFYDGAWPAGDYESVKAVNLLKTMDKYCIEKAWISSLTALVLDPIKANDRLFEFCSVSPQRLIPFYVVNPYYPVSTICDDIRRHRTHFDTMGIKAHPLLGGFAVTQEPMYKIAEFCEELSLPMMFHDGSPPYSDGLQIAALGELYPKLKIILGHAGLCDLWHDSAAAAEYNDNIHICFCCCATGDVERIVKNANVNKLLYGSDFYGIDSFTSAIENTLDGVLMANIPSDTKDKILYSNAEKLMKTE